MNFPATKSITLSRAHESRKVDDLEVSLSEAATFARKHSIAAIYRAGSGHPGAALSSAELLACLYGAELNLWPSTMQDPDRDRFVLSSGQTAPALYAVAAHFGFCDAHEALRLRKLGSAFQGLPQPGLGLDFVETCTATRAQGLGVAFGMALGLKLQRKSARVYALIGDQELQAGEVWETAMAASHQKLDNFCVIVDCSLAQRGVGSEAAMRFEPLASKWRACEWAVVEIDGHDVAQILSAFRRTGAVVGRPTLIIAHTVCGKGVPQWEGAPHWHGNVKLTRRQAEEALLALGARNTEIAELIDDDR